MVIQTRWKEGALKNDFLAMATGVRFRRYGAMTAAGRHEELGRCFLSTVMRLQ